MTLIVRIVFCHFDVDYPNGSNQNKGHIHYFCSCENTKTGIPLNKKEGRNQKKAD